MERNVNARKFQMLKVSRKYRQLRHECTSFENSCALFDSVWLRYLHIPVIYSSLVYSFFLALSLICLAYRYIESRGIANKGWPIMEIKGEKSVACVYSYENFVGAKGEKRDSYSTGTPFVLDSYSSGTPTFFWSTWSLAFPPFEIPHH